MTETGQSDAAPIHTGTPAPALSGSSLATQGEEKVQAEDKGKEEVQAKQAETEAKDEAAEARDRDTEATEAKDDQDAAAEAKQDQDHSSNRGKDDHTAMEGVPGTMEVKADPAKRKTPPRSGSLNANASATTAGNSNPEVPIPPLMLEKIVACRLNYDELEVPAAPRAPGREGSTQDATEGQAQADTERPMTDAGAGAESEETLKLAVGASGKTEAVSATDVAAAANPKDAISVQSGHSTKSVQHIEEAVSRLEAAIDLEKTELVRAQVSDTSQPGAYAVATTPRESPPQAETHHPITTNDNSGQDQERGSSTEQATQDNPLCHGRRRSSQRSSTASSTTGSSTPTTGGSSGGNTSSNDESHSSASSRLATATAFKISEADVEEEIRNRILSEAVEADVVQVHDHNSSALMTMEEQALSDITSATGSQNRRSAASKWLALVGIIVVLAILIAILVTTTAGSKDDDDGKASFNGENGPQDVALPVFDPNRSTLEIIRERGAVRCGISGDIRGFSHPNPETGVMEGLNVDQCRAMSMAVFGTPDNIELERVVPKDRFVKLANGTVDVLTITTTHTMERDVFESTSQTGHTFSAPFFYSGLIFAGLHSFVECADNLDSVFGDCRSLQICVITGTTHEAILQDLVPGGIVIAADSLGEMIDKFAAGECHVMASEPPNLPATRIRESGYDGPFTHGHKMFSREPLTLVTRKEDTEWSNLVNTIVNVLYLAESHGITQSNAAELYELLLPASEEEHSAADMELAAMMESIVAELGNYADIYYRHVEHIIPRRGLNLLYHQHQTSLQYPSSPSPSNGLLFSFPLGKVATKGFLQGPTLKRILERGWLRCGVPAPSPLEDVYPNNLRDLNIEFCRALAAALFVGDTEAVDIIELDASSSEEQCTKRHGPNLVDVVTGARVTLQLDYHGCAFSPAYFYHHQQEDHDYPSEKSSTTAIALMTADSDTEWSDFVYWTVMAIIYAEEENIGPSTIDQVKVVNLYGEQLKQSLRDCVLGVGSYGDMYNRTMMASDQSVSRSGGNLLNQGPAFGPQQYPLPFQ